MNHQPLEHLDDVIFFDACHFKVELRELRLSVRSQVLVAETTNDLHVTVESGNHEELLEDLRRLGKRIQLTRIESTRNQKIAGAFRRALCQHRRFKIDKSQLVQVITDLMLKIGPQLKALLNLGSAHVQKTVLKAQFVIYLVAAREIEGERRTVSQYRSSGADQLDLTGFQTRVFHSIGTCLDSSHHLKHLLRTEGFQRVDIDGVRGQRHLRASISISKIDEAQSPVITHGINPADKGDLFADVCGSKFTTGMASQHLDSSFPIGSCLPL